MPIRLPGGRGGRGGGRGLAAAAHDTTVDGSGTVAWRHVEAA